MKTANIHHEGVAARTATAHQDKTQPATIKLGVDIHQEFYVVVAQHDHATPQPPRRLRPEEFVAWVERLLARGHRVFIVYEAWRLWLRAVPAAGGAGRTC